MKADVRTVVWTLVALTAFVVALTGLSLAVMLTQRRTRRTFGRPDRWSAPLHWRYTPGEAQGMHRRLVESVDCARRAAAVIDGRRTTPSGAAEVADELAEEALIVDQGIILASRLDQIRRQEALARLVPAVADVEGVAQRLSDLAVRWDHGRHRPIDVTRLHRRLDVLEEAHREVEALEQALGER